MLCSCPSSKELRGLTWLSLPFCPHNNLVRWFFCYKIVSGPRSSWKRCDWIGIWTWIFPLHCNPKSQHIGPVLHCVHCVYEMEIEWFHRLVYCCILNALKRTMTGRNARFVIKSSWTTAFLFSLLTFEMRLVNLNVISAAVPFCYVCFLLLVVSDVLLCLLAAMRAYVKRWKGRMPCFK